MQRAAQLCNFTAELLCSHSSASALPDWKHSGKEAVQRLGEVMQPKRERHLEQAGHHVHELLHLPVARAQSALERRHPLISSLHT